MKKTPPAITIRKPTDPAAVERFVEDGKTTTRYDVETSKRQDGAASTVRVTRKSGRDLYRMTVYLPTELQTELATYCAGRHMSQSDALTEAARDWLAKVRGR